jgi:hypothetical protein
MAQQTNITVKKYDGVTDVVYSAVLPAAGGNAAVWRAPTLGTAMAHQPELRIRSTKNKAGTVQRVEAVVVYPEIITATDGSKAIANRTIVSASVTNPTLMATAAVQEGIAQALHLLASSHVKAQCIEGFAAV